MSAWILPIVASCSGPATSPMRPDCSRGLRPALISSIARRRDSAKRPGSGVIPESPSSTSERKYSCSHGTPVNWQRWVTSCKSDPEPELLGGEAVLALEAHDVGADVRDDVTAGLARACLIASGPREAGDVSSAKRMSYWPRTRVDIHPMTRPSWVPVTAAGDR